MVNGDHHGSQFDFYLEQTILEVSNSIPRNKIMPHSLPVAAQVINAAFGFIQSLFLRPAPVAARADAIDLRTLYQMSRGRDSVSPAVLRKLAEAAAR